MHSYFLLCTAWCTSLKKSMHICRGFVMHGYWTLHGPAPPPASAHFASSSCSSWTFMIANFIVDSLASRIFQCSISFFFSCYWGPLGRSCHFVETGTLFLPFPVVPRYFALQQLLLRLPRSLLEVGQWKMWLNKLHPGFPLQGSPLHCRL